MGIYSLEKLYDKGRKQQKIYPAANKLLLCVDFTSCSHGLERRERDDQKNFLFYYFRVAIELCRSNIYLSRRRAPESNDIEKNNFKSSALSLQLT